MNIHGQHYRTVWVPTETPTLVRIIDQRAIPWKLVLEDLTTVDEVAAAIKDMHVRGAGCIGATAAYGMWLAAHTGVELALAAKTLLATRPTAVNLAWAVNRMLQRGCTLSEAQAIADEDAAACQAIGRHGLEIIQFAAARKQPGEPVNILTHCNAGWLAFVDYGSATAPIYAAHDAGIPVHVWVDETRPRNQGAKLTAWELAEHGVLHTVIADNAGGHMMQHGQVDMVITGADRVTHTGDAANKIGTYLKALAAKDNGVPFYVALPSSTLDWNISDGVHGIPIEERGSEEVAWMDGPDQEGILRSIRIVPEASPVANPAFDVTPARLITGLITERGCCPATEADLKAMFQGSKVSEFQSSE